MLKIPEKIEYILNTLQENGYEAYIVGGCVRDALLGLTPHDYDITTAATPEKIIELFEKTIPTGIKHGTVTVLVEKEPVEVTTFRTEGCYSDSRRPDSVEFVTDLKEDLSRRDFTVNALAFSPKQGLQDYFCGTLDLENKILKAVGDPEKRFSEDALRILRLFRFASQLDFKIEENTFNAALNLCHTLENISHERIFTELLKAITGKKPQALIPLIESGALEFLGISSVFDFSILKNLRKNENLCLAAFLYKTCRHPLDTLKVLKCSNAQYRYCERFLRLVGAELPKTKTELKNALFLTEEEAVTDWLSYLKAVGENVENCRKMLNEIMENREPYLISHLAIDGKALKSLGLSGKAVGAKLEALRKAVAENPKLNTENTLIEMIKNQSLL